MSDGMAARKLRHIDACLTGPVEFVGVSTGFEWFTLPYNALTQTSLSAVDLGTEFLGASLTAVRSWPAPSTAIWPTLRRNSASA